jgi:hypothetical protein
VVLDCGLILGALLSRILLLGILGESMEKEEIEVGLET